MSEMEREKKRRLDGWMEEDVELPLKTYSGECFLSMWGSLLEFHLLHRFALTLLRHRGIERSRGIQVHQSLLLFWKLFFLTFFTAPLGCVQSVSPLPLVSQDYSCRKSRPVKPSVKEDPSFEDTLRW